VHQRMLILETLATAAQQMADPRLRLGAGRGQTGSQLDTLGGSDASSRGRVSDEGDMLPAVSCRSSTPNPQLVTSSSVLLLVCCVGHACTCTTVLGYIHAGLKE